MVRDTIEERILRGQRRLALAAGQATGAGAGGAGAGAGAAEGSPTTRGGAAGRKKDQDGLDMRSIRYLLGLPQR